MRSKELSCCTPYNADRADTLKTPGKRPFQNRRPPAPNTSDASRANRIQHHLRFVSMRASPLPFTNANVLGLYQYGIHAFSLPFLAAITDLHLRSCKDPEKTRNMSAPIGKMELRYPPKDPEIRG